jgi:hypothetical protein
MTDSRDPEDRLRARLRPEVDRLVLPLDGDGLRERLAERSRQGRWWMRPASVAAAAALVVAASFLALTLGPPRLPAVGSSPQPSTSSAVPVSLPVDSPLKPTDCGWPSGAPLAFAGWATIADLGAEQIIQGDPLAHVFALVTRDPIELRPMIGSPMLERGFCALRQDGSQVESGVPGDWAFRGTPQAPAVTCGTPITSCVSATLAVLDAVADIGRAAMRITLRSDQLCIGAPFHDRPCGAPVWPVGTQRMTSAVVTFSGTHQQAFLNVFWLADGSMTADVMALEAPPPGATPFP